MSSSNRPERYGASWNKDELILAFELYCRIPFAKTKASTLEVQELAAVLRRSPAAVARKLGNFGAFDPELQRRKIVGLVHGSQLDREVWDKFHADWNGLVLEAHRLRETANQPKTAATSVPFSPPTGPSERMSSAKQRIHQSFFRQAILSSYETTCCITRIRIPECLVASHIVPWSVDDRHRTDPSNGLCLSATFDRLFDSGLLTITPELSVQFAERLRKETDRATVQLVGSYHMKPISRPHRFLPAIEHLDWHRRNVFQE